MARACAVANFLDLSAVGAALVVALDAISNDVGRYGYGLSAETSRELKGNVEDR